MNKISLLFLFFTSILIGRMPQVLLGSIKFPPGTKAIPIKIYCCGMRVNTQIDEKTNEVFFEVPRNEHYIRLIICPQVKPVTKKDPLGNPTNTIEYLYVPETSTYRLYQMALATHLIDQVESEKNPKNQEAGVIYNWQIGEKSLDDKRRIPDNTIIVLCDPILIETINGGNKFELPTLVFKELDSAKIEQQLQYFLLSSLDLDTIHPKMVQHIKQIGAKTLVMPSA